MEFLKSRAPRTVESTATKMVLVNARLSEQLVATAKELAEKSNETLTDFVRSAIENEVSRRAMCPPVRAVTLADLDRKITALLDLTGSMAGEVELHSSALSAMHAAMGLDRE